MSTHAHKGDDADRPGAGAASDQTEGPHLLTSDAEGLIADDLSADLRLHDDELDPLDEKSESSPAVAAPAGALEPLEYDFSADLILRDEQDEGGADARPRGEVKQDPGQPLAAYDYSIDLRLEAGENLALPAAAQEDSALHAAAQEITDELRDMLPAVPALYLREALAEGAGSDPEYEPARELKIDSAEEDFLSDLPRRPLVPAESDGGVGPPAAVGPSALAAAAAEADSVLATQWASTRGRGNSRGGRFSPDRRAGRLSWLLRLESWLVLASLSLFFQLFPATFWLAMAVVDVRNWTWGVWVGVEIAVIGVLLLLKVRQAADA